jgi:anhydro-N-acetylmuramic acid kinase
MKRSAPALPSGLPYKAMTVAGVMSGTSADGVDVALVRCMPPRGQETAPRLRLLAQHAVPYPAPLRRAVLNAMNAAHISVAELSRLHWRLGKIYAEAVRAACAQSKIQIDLIGCHGQTIYHQAAAQPYCGAPVACTWQMGEAAVIAAATGVPVVADFRPADLALGGQGAPLVPLLDWVYFRHARRNRVLQNLGGIGNLTVIPAGAQVEETFAFDTGPANMVIDALMEILFQKKFDRNGAVAARGQVLELVLKKYIAMRYFSVSPPKSAGREEFGREFAQKFLIDCKKISRRPEDAVATATALTAQSIGVAWRKFVQPALRPAPTDFVVSGGGASNPVLLRAIAAEIKQTAPVHFTTSTDFGLPVAAKEAVAFALLAYQTWHRRPGNLPAATGAARPAILGKITYA